MQYIVVIATERVLVNATRELQRKIEERLKLGWELQGGVSISQTDHIATAAQAMTK